MNKVVLLLGSNLGDKKKNIETTLNIIDKEIGSIAQKSDLITTTPEDYQSNNNYLNIGVIINTNLSPIQLLNSLKKIERKLGRITDSFKAGQYEDRTIDIDIVYYNNIRFYSKKLIIPHLSHMSKREFSKKILQQLN